VCEHEGHSDGREWVQSSIFGNIFGSAQLTSDPFLPPPVSSPHRVRRRARPAPHTANAYIFSSTHHCPSTTLWCSPRRVSYTKLVDEHFQSKQRTGRCDGIGSGIQGKIAIQKIQASSFKPYRAVGGACLCGLLILEVWQRPFREQSHG